MRERRHPAAKGWESGTSVRVSRKAAGSAVGARLSKPLLHNDQLCAPLLQLLVLRCNVFGEVRGRALILRSCQAVTCCALMGWWPIAHAGSLALSSAAEGQDRALLADGNGMEPLLNLLMTCSVTTALCLPVPNAQTPACSSSHGAGGASSGMQAALSRAPGSKRHNQSRRSQGRPRSLARADYIFSSL